MSGDMRSRCFSLEESNESLNADVERLEEDLSNAEDLNRLHAQVWGIVKDRDWDRLEEISELEETMEEIEEFGSFCNDTIIDAICDTMRNL